MTEPQARIVPRNLTARAEYAVAGNPAISRPEDAVANTYPGLEINMLNLDARFFPGLVFDFVARDDHQSPYVHPQIYGACLDYVDLADPDLAPDGTDPELAELAEQLDSDLRGDAGTALSAGSWFLASIEQSGTRIEMVRTDGGQQLPMDGLWVWRLVRSLDPFRRSPDDPAAPVVVELHDRAGDSTVRLTGWRRRFTDPTTGVISLAYEPGELGQTLCSPWQHDFRDCACHYWAANHPDVVYGEIVPGAATLPDGQAADARRASTLLDWLREQRGPDMAAAAHNSIAANRPDQIDHYQINHMWQDLAVVVDSTEIGDEFIPAALPYAAEPFRTVDELVDALRFLATLEMGLALEYLAARFSIMPPDSVDPAHPTLSGDVTLGRQFLMLVAVGEMHHLRWANQIMWELHANGIGPAYEPVLEPAKWIPVRGDQRPHGAPPPPGEGWTWRQSQVRTLSARSLADFIDVEHPDAYLDRSYGRVVATLREPGYPSGLASLAMRVLEDGNEHYTRFRDLRAVLTDTYGESFDGYVREIAPGSGPAVDPVMSTYRHIRDQLRAGFVAQSHGDFAAAGSAIAAARAAMEELREQGEQLASQGIGVPFFPSDR